jgi:hypothetical protein
VAAQRLTIIVEPDGTVRHLVDDAHADIYNAFGPCVETWRNSHVETWSSLSWTARLWLVIQRRVPPAMLLPAALRPYRTRPLCNVFWADMRPVKGGVLGPFASHHLALAAEVAWLQEKNIPTGVV